MKPSQIQSSLNHTFSINDFVCIIDPAEDSSEWAVFIIRDFFNNKYRLTPIDRIFSYDKPLWVKTKQIIRFDQDFFFLITSQKTGKIAVSTSL